MSGVKCLLIAPGINSVSHRERLTTTYDFPNGILNLGSYLQAHVCSVELLPIDYYIHPTEERNKVLQQIRSIVESALIANKPLFVGISVPYTMLYPIALHMVEIVKEIMPHTVIGLGGPHVSHLDQQCFEDSPKLDVVIRGEGEWTLLELINTLEKGRELDSVAGVTYRKDGKVIMNPEVDPIYWTAGRHVYGGYPWLSSCRQILLPVAIIHFIWRSAIERRVGTPSVVILDPPVNPEYANASMETGPSSGSFRDRVKAVEASIINKAIENAQGDRRIAANSLGIGLSTLYRKLEEAEA